MGELSVSLYSVTSARAIGSICTMKLLSSSLQFAAPPGTAIRASGLGTSLTLVKRRLNTLAKFPVYGIPDRLCQTNESTAARRVLRVQASFGKKLPPVAVRETIVLEPDYRIPIVLLGAAGALTLTDNVLSAAPVGLLGLFLLFQTTRVKFVFGDQALEVRLGNELQDSGENVFVGGENRWNYSTFINWELWWPNFPVLVYFKETQTKPEGQVHFFPVIFDGKQLYDVMVERAGPSKTSSPK